MNKVFCKYRRGDVWFIRFENEKGDGQKNSSVQKKSRPHVIVSCEENNNNAPTFNVLPIETKEHDHLPCHVYYQNNGRDQTVLCEQIKTVSILDFQREGSHFMYSFTLDFMNEIDSALAGQLGIKARVADMKVLENMIDKLSKDREKELKDKYETNLEMRVEEIAAKIAKRFGISLDPGDLLTGEGYKNADLEFAPKDLIVEMNNNRSERVNIGKKQSELTSENNSSEGITLPWDSTKKVSTKVSEPKDESKPVSSKEVTKRKNKWTEDRMLEFLADKDTMSISELADKYGIKKKSVYQMAYICRDRLGMKE